MTAKRRSATMGAHPMGAPFLRQVVSLPESWDASRHPFNAIREVDYRETEHYRITRDFLNTPERYFAHLFADPGGEGDV